MDDELLKEFVSECREHLATIETDLLTIEEGGDNIDEVLVNKVFRAAHSIKGGSSFLGLNKVKELAHKAETVLDMLRSKKIPPNAEVTNVLLAAFDQLRTMINDAEQSERADISDLLVNLSGLASSYLPEQQKASLRTNVELPLPSGMAGKIAVPQVDWDRAKREGRFVYLVDCDLIHDFDQRGISVLALFRKLLEAAEILDCTVDIDAVGTLDDPVGNRVPLRLVVATATPPTRIAELFETIDNERIHLIRDASMPSSPLPPIAASKPLSAPAEIATPQESSPLRVERRTHEPSASHPGIAEDTLRVNVGLLETLMNLAGELVLSRNQLRAAVEQNNRQLLASANQRVNQVTSELQEVIMQTRLQPIGNVFAKFPRMVRDLSRGLGKDIQLDVIGKDVALDKTLIEGLSDPLTHLLRNAVDHGVETPEERVKQGKRPAGTVRIEARHEAGQVFVEIADDGKGLDPAKLVEAALRKGIISAEKAEGLSDRDKRALIFLPGFSTAKEVTEVSGRGVGMDVVKTNLDKLGGQIEIDSEVGRGSTFRIKLPLTLAIIPSLIVSAENERFAIPQANIEELLRIRPEDVRSRVEVVGDSEVLLLRDRILPLVRFADVMGAVPTYEDAVGSTRHTERRRRISDRRAASIPDARHAAVSGTESATESERRVSGDRRRTPSSSHDIAVVNTGTVSFGLVVDTFHNTEEVVVKPLGRRFKRLREYSGATILGDGTIALILDMAGISSKAGLSSTAGAKRSSAVDEPTQTDSIQDNHALLLFQNGPEETCAIPLGLVQRIEHITGNDVEFLGNNRTMQYRGVSLPLVTLSDTASVGAPSTVGDERVVIVANVYGREVGLLGTMPVDVIEVRTTIDEQTHRQKGIAGSAIIQGRTTLIVDLFELVRTVHPEWVGEMQYGGGGTGLTAKNRGDATTVLLAEDSDFFRGQVTRFLEEDGFRVIACPDGEAAWEALQENIAAIRAVVTDIEMPRLDGLGLASRIRGDARTSALPIIAVTSLAGDEDASRGMAAGIDDYQVKLDRDALVLSLRSRIAALDTKGSGSHADTVRSFAETALGERQQEKGRYR